MNIGWGAEMIGADAYRSPDSTIRVLLIDDHQSYIDAIRLLLESYRGIDVVGGLTDSSTPTKSCGVLVLTSFSWVCAFRAMMD